MSRVCWLACGVVLLSAAGAPAHDVWVEANSALVRTGEGVFVDLKLGNHGNHHRDYKLASKLSLDDVTMTVNPPKGKPFPVHDRLSDLGYAPNEGYWSTQFVTAASGLHTVSMQSDRVVQHGRKVRAIRGAKTYFIANPILDALPKDWNIAPTPLGHPLELCPLTHPVLAAGVGMDIRVQLLFEGEPLPETVVSFIPQGGELADGFDEEYERRTDAEGVATWTPRVGNRYLVVARVEKPAGPDDDASARAYTATLTLLIPAKCPCCE